VDRPQDHIKLSTVTRNGSVPVQPGDTQITYGMMPYTYPQEPLLASDFYTIRVVT
jgi:hypothetical protein